MTTGGMFVSFFFCCWCFFFFYSHPPPFLPDRRVSQHNEAANHLLSGIELSTRGREGPEAARRQRYIGGGGIERGGDWPLFGGGGL